MPRKIALVALVALLISACGSRRFPDHEQVSAQERIVVKFSHVVAENTPKGLGARRFAALVKERTGGRVEVQVFANSQLYQDGEELEALRSGEVQIIAPSLSKLEEIDPLWQVFDLPYLFENDQAVDRLISGTTGQRLYREMSRHGMEPIALWPNGFKQMTNARGPIVLPADLKGLRFRIQPSTVMRDALQALGAEVSVRSFDSVYAALAGKELDGQENVTSNIVSKRIYEVQPYMTVTNHGYLGYLVIVNKRFWEGLDPDIREVFREAMAETTQWVKENTARLNDEAFERIRTSNKVTIHQQTLAERTAWRSAVEPAYRKAEERLGADTLRTVLKDAKGE